MAVVDRSNVLEAEAEKDDQSVDPWSFVILALTMAGGNEGRVCICALPILELDSDGPEVCSRTDVGSRLTVELAPISLILTSSPSTRSSPASSCKAPSSPSEDALDCENRVLPLVVYVDMLELLGWVECLRLVAPERNVGDPDSGEGDTSEEDRDEAEENSPIPAAISLPTPCTPSRMPSNTTPLGNCEAVFVMDVKFEAGA